MFSVLMVLSGDERKVLTLMAFEYVMVGVNEKRALVL